MRRPRIQLYAPFLALLALQGAIMVLAPTAGESEPAAFADGEDGGDSGGAIAGTSPEGTDDQGTVPQAIGGDAATSDVTGQTTSDPAGDGPVGSLDESGENASVEDSAGSGDGADAAAVDGDTSHCTDDGRQHGFFYHAPPCEPASDGTNPGATYTGVTEDEILVIQMYNQGHPLLDAIIPTEISDQDQDDFRLAAQDFINSHYELHGRQVRIEAVRSNCPTTPPNPSRCREEVRRVIDMDPFMVLWGGGGYPTIYDEFARAGIIAIGASNLDESFYNQRRPFRYALGMDGTQMREHLAEYYCKKLAGGVADRSGEVIHPQIGNRGEVPRRYGIVTPDTPSAVANANALVGLIEQCDGYRPPVFTYELDIERGLEQATAVVAGLISEGVTTVTCVCDPVAPQFLLDEATMQDWHPEHLMLGINVIDGDPVGRIYDQDQWSRAFGPSTLAEAPPLGENDADAMWEAAGRDGECVICRENPLTIENYRLVGHLLQAGGADLNPGTVERGAFEYGARGGWAETGDPGIDLRELGPDNYAWGQDMREVYWDPDAISTYDGEPGTYVPVDGGRRYVLGEWTNDLDVPMP